jgi:orotate phosphoribosyltransferase
MLRVLAKGLRSTDMTDQEALDLFRESGALLQGHFLLSSGLHSAQYLEKFRLVERPATFERMSEALAASLAECRADYVLGPTTAGIILAYCVARHLGIEARYAEPAQAGRELKRGQELPAASRVVIVDDILTTGLSVRECMAVVSDHGAQVAGIGVLADRSGGSVTFGASLHALVTLDIPAYTPKECPMCRDGIALTKRGSRAKP